MQYQEQNYPTFQLNDITLLAQNKPLQKHFESLFSTCGLVLCQQSSSEQIISPSERQQNIS